MLQTNTVWEPAQLLTIGCAGCQGGRGAAQAPDGYALIAALIDEALDQREYGDDSPVDGEEHIVEVHSNLTAVVGVPAGVPEEALRVEKHVAMMQQPATDAQGDLSDGCLQA